MALFRREQSIDLPAVSPSWLQWPTLAWGNYCAVHGESHYQDALWRMCGSGASGPIQRVFVAQLVPEPTNRYDPNAVQVLLGGALVGYLPKETAPEVQPMLMAWARSGHVATCRADVRGGTRDKPLLGIVLHAGSPFRPFAVGSPFLEGERSVGLPLSAETRDSRQAILARYGDGARLRAWLGTLAGSADVAVWIDQQLVGRVDGERGRSLGSLIASATAAGFAPEASAEIYANKKSVGARLFAFGCE